MMKRNLLLMLVSCTSAIALGTETSAQTAPPTGAAIDPATAGEIVVTAQHRRQSVQDVPISITALSGEELQKSGIDQPVDLGRVTPGLSTVNATSGGTPIFAIRGIGLDDFNPNNNSGVATYIDGVAISSPEILSGQMFDVDRVEVLKGPQGTLYGRNATGGAINFFSRQPTSTPTGYLTLDYGRWDTIEANGAISGPITEGLQGRLAFSYTKAFKGWQTDLDTGRQFGKPDRRALRGTLKYSPDSNLDVVLNVHVSQDHSISLSPQAEGNEALLPAAAAGQIDTGTSDPSKVRVGSLNPHRHDQGVGAALTFTYRLPTFTLSSISGYDHYIYRSIDNNDGIPGPTFDFFQHDIADQFYQEFRAASTKPAFNGFTDWTVGVSYSRDRLRGLDSSDQSAPFVGQFLTPPDFTTSGLSIAQANYVQTRESVGIYGNTENHLTQQLSLILGMRYSHDVVAFNGVSTEEGSENGGVVFKGIGSVVASMDQSHKTDNVSYRIGFDYKVTPKILTYATISSAYKSGAYYASPALDPAAWAYVPPEKITAYEAGVKSRLFDNLLQVDGSVFYYNYTNRQSQLLFVSPVDGFLVVSLASIPKSTVFGQEVQVDVHPLNGLEFSLGISHLDAKVTETTTNVRGAPLFSPIPVGTQLAQSPNWSYVIGGRYERLVSNDWKGLLQLSFSYQGDQASVLGDPNAIYGPQKNLSGRIGLTKVSTGLSIALWGRNLTNSKASTYSYTSFYGGKTVFRQQPTSYGVELGYSF